MKTQHEMIEAIDNEIDQEFGFANEDTIVAIKGEKFEVDADLSNQNYYETNGYVVAICPKDADIKNWLEEFFDYLTKCIETGR